MKPTYQCFKSHVKIIFILTLFPPFAESSSTRWPEKVEATLITTSWFQSCRKLNVRELVGTFGRAGNQMLCLTNIFPNAPNDYAVYVPRFISSQETVDVRRYFNFTLLQKNGFCYYFEGDNTHAPACRRDIESFSFRNKRRGTKSTCIPARKAFLHKSYSSMTTTLPIGRHHDGFFGGLEWNTEFSRRCQEAFRAVGLVVEDLATIHLRHMEGLLPCDDQTRHHQPLQEWSERLGYHKNSVQWWCPYRVEEALDLLSCEGYEPKRIFVASDHQKRESEERYKAFGVNTNSDVFAAYKKSMQRDGKAVATLDEVWLDVWAMSHSKYLLGHPSSSLSYIAYKLNESRTIRKESHREGAQFAFPFQPSTLKFWNYSGVAIKGPDTVFDMRKKALTRAQNLVHKSAIVHDNSLRSATRRTLFSSIEPL
ncbi:hypothetical protein RI054_16g75970 [Pseudoscourfieldia marina]